MDVNIFAEIAEQLAAKNMIGDLSDPDYMDILQYYPENDPKEFYHCWCAAFVYHCCRLAGMHLPLGTGKTGRKGQFRYFTGCIAWVEWARHLGYLLDVKDGDPRRGDIVIYNQIIPAQRQQKDSLWCDHIGIVLESGPDTITAAEGNVDNRNVSGIVTRPRDATIGCYIRIPEKNPYDDWQGEIGVLSLREMGDTEEDMAQLLEWLSNPSVTDWAWGEHAPWNMKKVKEHFSSKARDEAETPCFVEMDGEPIGYLQFYPIREDSYRFRPPIAYERFSGGYGMDIMIGYPGLWNKGVGSKAIRMTAHYLFSKMGAALVCADPEKDNPRSVACWKKAGFTAEGILPGYDNPEKESVFMVLRPAASDESV